MGGGESDVTQDATGVGVPFLLDVLVKGGECAYCLVRIIHRALSVLASLPRYLIVLPLGCLGKPFLVLDDDSKSADSSANGREEFLVRSITEEENVDTRLALRLAFKHGVWPLVRWEDDMTSSIEEELFAVAAFGHEEAASALDIRRGHGSDGRPSARVRGPWTSAIR